MRGDAYADGQDQGRPGETCSVQKLRRRKKAIPSFERAVIALRHGCAAGETKSVPCHWCGRVGSIHWFITPRSVLGWVATLNLEFDHVVPEFLGGPPTAANLVLACRRCNRSRGWRAFNA